MVVLAVRRFPDPIPEAELRLRSLDSISARLHKRADFFLKPSTPNSQNDLSQNHHAIPRTVGKNMLDSNKSCY
jgi:hypothetical protein